MALQGTIDTFDLTEVIRMLAVGEKSGRLGLSGDRGSGSIWFVDGRMVASDTDASLLAVDHAAVLFQLLRFGEGSFVFDQGATAPDAGSPVDSEPVIEEALRRREEWTEIEAVVPSLDHRLTMAAELGRSDVVIDQARWRVLALIAGGATVGNVGTALEFDELEISRTVKELVELTLVEVGEPIELAEPEPVAWPVAEADPEDEDGDDPVFSFDAASGAQDDAEDGAGAFAPDVDGGDVAAADDVDLFDADWLSSDTDHGGSEEGGTEDNGARSQLDALASGFGLTDDSFSFEPASDPIEAEPVDASGRPLDFAEPEPLPGAVEDGAGSFPIEAAEAAGEARTPLFAHDAEAAAHVPAPGEAAEVARQLANLSPEAARAVAAAARATTVEEREAALALVAEDGDEPLDPDLLRSFLSSVRN